MGITQVLYSRLTWPLLTEALAESRGSSACSRRPTSTPDGSYSTLQFSLPAVLCVGSTDRPSVAQVVGLARRLEKHIPSSTPTAISAGSCSVWPVRGDDAGSDPILVLGVTNDPATPYQWAPRLADQLRTAVLLTLDGQNQRIDDGVNAFLLDGTVPAKGTRCGRPRRARQRRTSTPNAHRWSTVSPRAATTFTAGCRPGGGAEVTPQMLVGRAVKELVLPLPQVSSAPPRGRRGMVEIRQWFWLDGAGQWTTKSKRVQVGDVWAEVTASLRWLVIAPGAGLPDVVCDGPGTPYDSDRPPQEQESGCTLCMSGRRPVSRAVPSGCRRRSCGA